MTNIPSAVVRWICERLIDGFYVMAWVVLKIL